MNVMSDEFASAIESRFISASRGTQNLSQSSSFVIL